MPTFTPRVRLAKAVYRLLENPMKGISVSDLKEEFEIQPRTMRGFRRELQAFFEDLNGAWKVKEHVETGGERRIFLVRNDDSDTKGGELEQAFNKLGAAFFATRIFESLGTSGMLSELHSVANYVRSSFSAEFRADYNTALNNLDRMFVSIRWGAKDYANHSKTMFTVMSCMFGRRGMELQYRKPNKQVVVRLVEVLSLLQYREGWYIVARELDEARRPCGEEKLYAIDRIESNEMKQSLKHAYPERHEYDPSTLFEANFGLYRTKGAPLNKVVLHFEDVDWIRQEVTGRRWHRTQSTSELEDGRFEVSFMVYDLTEMEPWVRQFTPYVEVVEPQPQTGWFEDML